MWNNLRYQWPLHFVLLLTNWLPDNVVFLRLRGWLAHFFFLKCGNDLRLGRSIVFYNPAKIIIGSNVYIAYGNWFSASETINIDNQVVIGPKCNFSSGNHTMFEGSIRYGRNISSPIHIGKGSWVAGNCSIIAGTTIGHGTIVGANSVVLKNIESNSLYAGTPARKIKSLE